MRLSSVIAAIGAFTLGVNASASPGENKAPLIVARTDSSSSLLHSSTNLKRHVLNEGRISSIKKKVRRGTGQCRLKDDQPAKESPIPQQHNVIPEPPKQPEPVKQAEPPKQQEPVKRPEPVKQPEPAPAPAPAPPSNDNNGGGDANSRLGWINGFQGTQTNAILSWFQTNHGGDSTNGMSWCQTRYKDDWDCFAPSVGTMLKNFNYDYVKAAKAYCGREAEITYNGKTTKAFICDGFDDKWVRTPSSLDLTTGLFRKVYGSFDWDKMKVGKGATWRLTGNVVEQGTFQKDKYGPGNPR